MHVVLYVAFVASLNLCLGYVLGVYIGVLPGHAARRAAPTQRQSRPGRARRKTTRGDTSGSEQDSEQDDHAVDLQRQESVDDPETGESDWSFDSSLTSMEVEDPVDATKTVLTDVELKSLAAPSTDADDVEKNTTTTGTTGESGESATSAPEEGEAPDHAQLSDFLSGLKVFQRQLAEIDEQLTQAPASEEVLGECVAELHSASESYLTQVDEASQQLQSSGHDSDELADEKSHLRQSIVDQVQLVKDQSESIRTIDLSQDVEAAKDALLSTSAHLSQSAGMLETDLVEFLSNDEKRDARSNSTDTSSAPLTEDDATPPLTEDDATPPLTEDDATPPLTEDDAAPPLTEDDAAALMTRASAERSITEYCQSRGDSVRLPVALIDIDEGASVIAQHGEEIRDRLINGMARVVNSVLASEHAAARRGEHQLLLVLPGETADSASRLVEEVRQRIECTRFDFDGNDVSLTVSCGITEATSDVVGEKLFSRLEEALHEANRFGRNRAFWHDGSLATPVVPPELTLTTDRQTI